MNSRKNTVVIGVFSVNQLEYNVTSENIDV